MTTNFDKLYEANQASQGALLMGQVKNLMALPKWIGGEDRFSIRLQDEKGHHFYIVDAATGQKQLAFDHAAVAKALTDAGAGEQQPDAIGMFDLSVEGDERVLIVGRDTYRCKSDGSQLRKQQPPAKDVQWKSPDGKQAAFVRDHNLWLRDLASGTTRALTSNGTAKNAYGNPRPAEFNTVQLRRTGEPPTPQGVFWSPDGQFLVTFRVDFTDVPERTQVAEFAAPDQRYTHSIIRTIDVAGDHHLSRRNITIVDVASGRIYPAQLTSEQLQDWAWHSAFESLCLWWHAPGKQLFLSIANWRGNRYGIAQVDLPSGQARVVVEESEEHAYMYSGSLFTNLPNFRVFNQGRELLWYSHRSGHGHLYLYDVASGKLKRAVTSGDWVVYGLLHVDETARQVYFSAAGKEPGRNPYYRHLYRVSLDGGEPKLLTPEDADHEFGIVPYSTATIAPSGRYIADVYSTVTQPPVGILRRSDGTLVSEIYRADASGLQQVKGWRPAEPFVTLAADGKTKLYGVMYKPADFDPGKRYPILDMTYPGPHSRFTPTNFMGVFQAMLGNPQLAANLGMIVVAFDARGCGGRDHAFAYAHAGTEDVLGSADHVAAIKHLAAQNPFMDINRVGIYGASTGGYAAVRAQLLHGDFFKACVSGVAPTDWSQWGGGTIWCDRYFRISDDPKKADEYFQLLSNARIADRLQGKLLLIYGEIDENVPLHHAFLMFEALQKAGKDYETLLMTNQTHGAFAAPYAVKCSMRFLFDHLQAGA